MRRTRIQNTRKQSFTQTIKLGLTGLLFCIPFVTSHAQEASYHDHNIYHGAGDAYVNTSTQAQQVGEGGVLRAQLIWNVTPNQTVGADIDLHAKLPDGNGQYLVTQFDPIGALPYTPQKNPPFGNPNTSATGNQQVNWVNRQVAFNPSQNPQTLGQPLSIASLDQDNRTGVPNSPAGALVENIYIKGATPASPNNIPSGTYQFAVHDYNQTKLADPQADYAIWITTNGKVGIRSDGHYTGTGQAPVYTGHLQNEGDSSRIYEIDIVIQGMTHTPQESMSSMANAPMSMRGKPSKPALPNTAANKHSSPNNRSNAHAPRKWSSVPTGATVVHRRSVRPRSIRHPTCLNM